MATFALIHGGGSTAWDWHLVSPILRQASHAVVAVDLPIEDPNAGLDDYVRTVTDAVGTRDHVIVVGHSLGGFTAPLVADALDAEGLVFFTAMIPRPGETFMQWWSATGHDQETIDDDPEISFFNGVPPGPGRRGAPPRTRPAGRLDVAPVARRSPPRHPDDGDRLRRRSVLPRAVHATPDRRPPRRRTGREIPGGHYAALTHPLELAVVLDRFAGEIATNRTT